MYSQSHGQGQGQERHAYSHAARGNDYSSEFSSAFLRGGFPTSMLGRNVSSSSALSEYEQQQHHHGQQLMQHHQQQHNQQQGYDDYGYHEGYGNMVGGGRAGEMYEIDGVNEYPGDPGELEPPTILEEGQWGEHSTIPSPSQYDTRKQLKSHSVVSLEYDSTKEMLWAGYECGRVSSFAMTNPVVDDWTPELMQYGNVPPLMQRYSSFMASEDGLSQVIPLQECIISVSPTKLRLHSDGGLPMGSFSVPEVMDEVTKTTTGLTATNTTQAIGETKITTIQTTTANFTCALALRQPGSLVTGPEMMPTHVVAGTSSQYVFAFDFLQFKDLPVLTFDVGAASKCLRSSTNGLHIIAAGVDGKLRLLDARLRSKKVQHVLDAHSGPISDISVQPDGVTLISCGLIGRPVNQFDPKSPVNYLPDPLVRVYDLRMNRQLAPLSMSVSSPGHVKFLPSYKGDGTSSVVMAGSTGVLQISSLHPLDVASSMQMLYVPLADRREKISSLTTSSSGHFICAGNTGGGINQYIVGLSDEHSNPPLPRVNLQSLPLVMPPSAPVVPMSVPTNERQAPIVGTSYTLLPRPGDMECLASSYETTERLLHQPMELSSTRKISEDILRKVSWKDFIGTVSNPGFQANSMIFGTASKQAYDVCDPRKKNKNDDATFDSNSNGIRNNMSNIPRHLYRIQSHRGKQKMNKFNYAAYNQHTSFIGLENNCPNSYTNSLLQFLFALPEVRSTALASQLSPYHHNNPTTVWCELGFLFHMMRSIQNEYLTQPASAATNIAKVVTPANFQRTFQQVGEAVALSLFDGSLTDQQLLMQTFARFIFQQLQSEYDQEWNRQRERSASSVPPSAVEHVFGHSVVTSTTFLVSGSMEIGVTNRAFAVDLIYPNVSKGALRASFIKEKEKEGNASASSRDHRPSCQPHSFANILWGSLQKESHMRGWCQASGNLEPFKQVRSIISLPRILAVQCGDTQRDPKEATISGALGEAIAIGSMHQHFWSRLNNIGGPWLPQAIEIAIQRSEPSENGKRTVLKLIVSALQIEGKESDSASSINTNTTTNSSTNTNAKTNADTDAKSEVTEQTSSAGGGEQKASPPRWLIYDGKSEISSLCPASGVDSYRIENGKDGWEVARFGLLSVISQVTTPDMVSTSETVKHVVLHMKSTSRTFDEQRAEMGAEASDKATQSTTTTTTSKEESPWKWYAINDFSVTPSSVQVAASFEEWRHPCMIFFSRTDYEDMCLSPNKAGDGFPVIDFDTALVPASVLQLPSLSQTSCIRISPGSSLPNKGDLVAFDGEFVSVEAERAEVNKEGHRVVSDEGRQVLARISIVDGGSAIEKAGDAASADAATRSMRVLTDDYILPCEAVVDYVTRFSGITAEDLSPATTRHALVPNRTAYLKLRFFIDRGCLFVGHGLQKDFETANVFVSPNQIIDTVELWRLQNQRKISLRFLASHLLKADIQDGIHDSIEDAKTALSLYRHYEAVMAQGQDVMRKTLQELYDVGTRTGWFTVGTSHIGEKN